jgi:hypothetical protein
LLSVVNAFSDRNHKAMDQVEACQLVYRGPVFLVLDLDAFGITMPHRRGSPATLSSTRIQLRALGFLSAVCSLSEPILCI